MMDDPNAGTEEEQAEQQQVVKAIPTFILVGTLQGGVFRANLASCIIQVETGDLVCSMEWYKVAHDGPVTTVTRSPFFSDLVLTVGGYLFAVWRETELTQPLIVKSSGEAGLTGGCWSLSRASFVFTSCEDGTIQCWNLLAGGNSPIQKQNTSGYTITCITGYYADPEENTNGDITGHYLSIADTTGTIRLLTLPKHMHETTSTEESDTRDFTIRETERLKFITGRSVGSEDDSKSDKKSEKGDKEEDEENGAEEEKEEELSPSAILYNRYKKMEAEVLAKVGMTKKATNNVDRKKSIMPTGNKAFDLLKP
eukprot:TRINITY_DN32910_c0_g1_i1.p1 TRINITY_DN32910_c0_g1~~TRINITY_DN32910_c0_g1_i1.p1  ORF type:complete len:311 (-),score=94.34 TRINITY_DN32910_c0_g1_i1:67-999(-)